MENNGLYNRNYSYNLGKNHVYQRLRNKLRVSCFTKLLKPSSNEKILEIGFGTGDFLKVLSSHEADVYGADINTDQIKMLNNPNIRLIENQELPFEDSIFDKVCAFEVIEHVPDMKKFLTEISRVVKKKGRILLSFPQEIIRGTNALGDAISVYGNPYYCRRLHLHNLTPKKISKLTCGTSLNITSKELRLLPFPTFIVDMIKE